MSKIEKLDLIFGKCFYSSSLDEKEVELICNCSSKDFEGLNLDQVNLIKNWCNNEKRRIDLQKQNQFDIKESK